MMTDEDLILLIGAGNEFRSDDAVGPVIAKKIYQLYPDRIKYIKDISDSTNLIEHWKKRKHVFFIDAVCSGCDPGTVFRFDALNEEIPENISSNLSTHTFNLKEAIELARNLDSLPLALIVYGIECRNFEYGKCFSPEIKPAISEVIIKIKQEIDELVYAAL
ncbi:MAG: hydrogenase maturation protease [candidate division Zixibacteria bacterium]|nr:hydrogenase maturation protease [candidate division Zixibacteria bacterium]NIR64077.1 hydrogenase maturation protease [candidate division Zixibacteria bacterium]NIS15406.1 hydrogenase maturation protease [candidate division Zixibacteria bacterium]NIS45975.1 hydrogenase maturation protease [candidate division Zixibacteria bacterium]NIT51934.1 hydrogenase maturation protease [candidate division Zixibacteria bacterium]